MLIGINSKIVYKLEKCIIDVLFILVRSVIIFLPLFAHCFVLDWFRMLED